MRDTPISIEQRISELGLVLPKVKAPAANYANCLRVGDLVYLSGTVPVDERGEIPRGKVGGDVPTAVAASHARMVGLHQLAILREELGSLDRARRVVKLLGFVNAVPEFTEHSAVINGCSDLLVDIFGSVTPARRSASEASRSGSRSRSS